MQIYPEFQLNSELLLFLFSFRLGGISYELTGGYLVLLGKIG